MTLSESGVKCVVTPRKHALKPGFDQISAHILMITALFNNNPVNDCISCSSLEKLLFDEVPDIFYPFLEITSISTKEKGTLVSPMIMANFLVGLEDSVL